MTARALGELGEVVLGAERETRSVGIVEHQVVVVLQRLDHRPVEVAVGGMDRDKRRRAPVVIGRNPADRGLRHYRVDGEGQGRTSRVAGPIGGQGRQGVVAVQGERRQAQGALVGLVAVAVAGAGVWANEAAPVVTTRVPGVGP